MVKYSMLETTKIPSILPKGFTHIVIHNLALAIAQCPHRGRDVRDSLHS
jgi:hypothetical protein